MQNEHLEDLANLEFARNVELLKEDNRMTVEERLLRKSAEIVGTAGKITEGRLFKK
jgi:hypothetical protein